MTICVLYIIQYLCVAQFHNFLIHNMIIIVGILLSIILSFVSYTFKTDYLHSFLTNEVITIMGVMLSINCASASNLHLKLTDTEEKLNNTCYKNTKREIKHNILYVIISFLLAIILLFINSIIHNEYANYIIDSAMMTIFLLQIYAIYEITIKFILKIEPLIDAQHSA